MTPWGPECWTSDMKKKINELLCNTRPPKRYGKVAQAYNEIAYGKAEDKDSTFKITSAYFIEKYDKEMCHKLESSACVNFSDNQADTIRRITQQLATPVQVQSCIIRPEFAPCPILPQPSITLTQPLGRLANVSASFNVSSSTTIRKCRHCGLPKSKMVGQVNLHNTHIKKGEPCLFYCPVKMSKKFGIPANMSFDDFKRSPHWEAAMEEARQETEHAKQKKAEAEAKRKEKGWKKPGTKPKDKKD